MFNIFIPKTSTVLLSYAGRYSIVRRQLSSRKMLPCCQQFFSFKNEIKIFLKSNQLIVSCNKPVHMSPIIQNMSLFIYNFFASVLLSFICVYVRLRCMARSLNFPIELEKKLPNLSKSSRKYKPYQNRTPSIYSYQL